MKYVDEEEILFIHDRLIEVYGGSHGTRHLQRIKSVVAAPKQVVFGQEQYESVYEKAAVYARNIIGDHPFVDGNKRVGITTAVVFLERNGHIIIAKQGQLEDFAVRIATDSLEIKEIADWFKQNSELLRKEK